MEEKGSEIRDCNFERDTGFGDFTKRDPENVIFGKSVDENVRNQPVILQCWEHASLCKTPHNIDECRKLASKMYPRSDHAAIL